MGSSLRKAIALILIVVALGLASCGGDRNAPIVLLEGDEPTPTINPLIGAIAEVSPPERIQQLKPYLDVYEPQVRIVSPRENETLQDTSVAVELQVRDFPLYKNADLGLGPHLHLFLDDQPYQAVYDTSTPVVFDNLAPGTHTLRVFASRPWYESFKNEGAYDQVTFNIFTESSANQLDNSQALLTFSRPQGSYGAEPIMLDFYLTNAPLHMVAENNETISDWRMRCTVNGESFVFDRWQPLYLKGFNPGKNWVKLELIDENGNLIENTFNTGIRIIEYTPNGEDALAKLVRGDIPLSSAKVLVDPNYVPPAPVLPETPQPTVVEPQPTVEEPELNPDEKLTPIEPEGAVGEEPPQPDEHQSANQGATEPNGTPQSDVSVPAPALDSPQSEVVPETEPTQDEQPPLLEPPSDLEEGSKIPTPSVPEFTSAQGNHVAPAVGTSLTGESSQPNIELPIEKAFTAEEQAVVAPRPTSSPAVDSLRPDEGGPYTLPRVKIEGITEDVPTLESQVTNPKISDRDRPRFFTRTPQAENRPETGSIPLELPESPLETLEEQADVV